MKLVIDWWCHLLTLHGHPECTLVPFFHPTNVIIFSELYNWHKVWIIFFPSSTVSQIYLFTESWEVADKEKLQVLAKTQQMILSWKRRKCNPQITFVANRIKKLQTLHNTKKEKRQNKELSHGSTNFSFKQFPKSKGCNSHTFDLTVNHPSIYLLRNSYCTFNVNTASW